MSREESSSNRSSRPRSRQRAPQPTATQLAALGIKVKDFAYESTLPPVRTVYRQPRQVQPSIPRPLHREDTEPLKESQGSQPVHTTVPASTITRAYGAFFDSTSEGDPVVNSRMSMAIQETENLVPTPIVTPNGSLQWQDTLPSTENFTPPVQFHLHSSLSAFSSPLTPLPPTPPALQGPSFIAARSPSMVSSHTPSRKRRKISFDNILRPGLKRYYLRKRSKIKH